MPANSASETINQASRSTHSPSASPTCNKIHSYIYNLDHTHTVSRIQANRIRSRLLGRPRVWPERPGIVLRLSKTLHWNVILFRIETNHQILDRGSSAPGDPHNTVFELSFDEPFLYSNGHGRGVNRCRLKITGQ